MRDIAALPTLAELRQHVLNILCRNDNLDPGQTPLQQALITRQGKPCGLFFQARGPRMLKTYAVWAAREHRVLFYGSDGTRFGETKLSESPRWTAVSASPITPRPNQISRQLVCANQSRNPCGSRSSAPGA